MPRRKPEETVPPGIVVLYTSLMILLLAFFILFNALGRTEETKVEAALQSLAGTFGFHGGGSSPLSSRGSATMPGLRDAPLMPADADYLTLRGLAKTEGRDQEIKFLRSGALRTVALAGVLLFEPDSAKLSPQGQAFLRQVAEVVADRLYPISVKGHTDQATPASPATDKFALSGERALAVVAFLATQGVAPNRLAAFGLADHDPLVAPNHPQASRFNNRVDLVFNERDQAHQMLPEGRPAPGLNFRGFSFDLFGPEEKAPQGGR